MRAAVATYRSRRESSRSLVALCLDGRRHALRTGGHGPQGLCRTGQRGAGGGRGAATHAARAQSGLECGIGRDAGGSRGRFVGLDAAGCGAGSRRCPDAGRLSAAKQSADGIFGQPGARKARARTNFPPPAAPAVPKAIAASGAGDAPLVAALQIASHGPLRYVTPAGTLNAPTLLRTQLADYIVAHSAYSTPLLRRNVLSELVTSEDQMGIASSYTGAAGAAQGTLAGGGDAIRSTSDSSR